MPKKHWILLILVTVAVAIILMAAGLSNLELRPGRVRLAAMESEEMEPGGIPSLGPFLGILAKISLLISGALALVKET